MKEVSKNYLGMLAILGLLVFVGLAVHFNVHDALAGEHTAMVFNMVGFCLVPIMALFCVYVMKRSCSGE